MKNEINRDNVEWLEAIDSTNKYLLEHPRDDRFVVAKHQSSGYGRKGDKWHSPDGENIYMSYGFFYDGDIDGLSLAMGMAVASVMKTFGASDDIVVKWPNDVLVNGKKIAGILIETEMVDGKRFICIGVGVNVNSDFSHLGWTSCRVEFAQQVSGRAWDIETTCEGFMKALVSMKNLFLEKGMKSVLESWESYSHLPYGAEIELKVNNETIYGTYMGVANDGAIIISGDSYRSGSIVMR